MKSQALEILETLGGEFVRYIPRLGSARQILALVEPLRRVDELGQQQFLTKTYEVWLVRSATEGMTEVVANADAIKLKLNADDRTETTLKITKIYPDREAGNLPTDKVGMWHLEAVA